MTTEMWYIHRMIAGVVLTAGLLLLVLGWSVGAVLLVVAVGWGGYKEAEHQRNMGWEFGREEGYQEGYSHGKAETQTQAVQYIARNFASFYAKAKQKGPEAEKPLGKNLVELSDFRAESYPDDVELLLGAETVEGVVTQKPVKIKLTEADAVLIGAPPRFGKSVLARSLVLQLLQKEYVSPGFVRLGLIDITGVTFNREQWAPMKQVFGVAQTETEIMQFFGRLEEEVKRREALFHGYPEVEKLQEYNKLPGVKREPYVVVFIEELPATLGMLGASSKERLMSALFRLPKYGIYIIGLAQRITVQTLGPGRDAFNTRVWLGRMSRSVRQILEINEDTGDIIEKGRGVYVIGNSEGTLQAVYSEKSALLEMIAKMKQARG